ncbi:IS1595 family transposase [Methylobacterium sp. W2]|uniref:IS1595 family transposase n=1 Tax=Methylobacterium sp. W2 TaxID=2598107 RepID=UPI001D0BF835|nr:IS1595 family transposase [Methylobacterium sp. W2]MCC0809010.1 IS1595 family transposase [Methylobacterium sp. W2]
MSALSAKFFHDEAAAFEKLESLLWSDGPVCAHCGGMGRITRVKGGRMGLRRCGDCKKQFTVTVGTVFESSHVKLHLWLQAAHLLCSSKKGMSSHQIHRILGVTYKTAWFMTHRLREAMREGAFVPFGSGGGIVEIDETFIGNDRTVKPKGEKKGRGYAHKHKVLSLVDRDTGQKRSMVVDDLSAKTLLPILKENIAKEARVMTDEAGQYGKLSATFTGGHGFTRHGQGEYVDLVDRMIHTNTIEGAFSVFKRGMKGVYQHCGKQHLHRYLAEFDFRYNNRVKLGCGDAEQAERALKGIVGKRLTYRLA